MENVLAAKYPIQPLSLLVCCRPASRDAAKLVDWVYSKEGQEIVEKVGYYPLTETDRLNFAARASGGTMKAATAPAKKKS